MRSELNSLIMQAMKEHNMERTETLRAIKTAFMNWETSKEHVGQEMTETDEIQILKKIVKQREESADMYQLAHRQDLVDKEIEEANIIKGFLPADATEEEIIETLVYICNTEHIACDKRNMGVLIRKVKETLPNADGKLVAQVVSKNI